MGDINVFTDPMKCGKTQKILNELDRQLIAGKNIKVFKPTIDNRFGNNSIQTRSGQKIEAINIDSIDELQNYNADIYFIDEFQFLTGNVNTIEKMARKWQKILYFWFKFNC